MNTTEESHTIGLLSIQIDNYKIGISERKTDRWKKRKREVRREDRNDEVKYEKKELGVKKRRYNFFNWKGKSFP